MDTDTDGTVYRAAVVGLGFIGGEAEDRHLNYPGRIIYPHGHVAAFARSTRTDLVAGADLSAKRLESFEGSWKGARPYTNYRKMLGDARPDIVGIATPASHHKQAVLDAVEAGVRGILCEKPLATNLKDADAMLAACDKAGVKISVNTWRRWEPFYLRARTLLADGAIGTLRTMVGHWSGLVLSSGSHGFDILNFFAGTDVDWLIGHLDDPPSEKDPGGDTFIQYRSGVRAFVNGRSGTSAQFEVELFGNAGKMKIGNFHAELWKQVSEDGRRVLVQFPFPSSGPMPGPMLTGVDELAHCIETGEEPTSSGRLGRLALAMGIATHESSRRGNVKIQFPYDNGDLDVPCAEKPAPD